MLRVTRARIPDPDEEGIVIFTFVVSLVLPLLVIGDAFPPAFKGQVAFVSKSKQVVAAHQKAVLEIAGFEERLTHDDLGMGDLGAANLLEHLVRAGAILRAGKCRRENAKHCERRAKCRPNSFAGQGLGSGHCGFPIYSHFWGAGPVCGSDHVCWI